MNELHIYFKNLLNQSADDDEFAALLNETALSGTNISNLNFKIVEKNKKQLEKLYHTEISYPLAVLLTNIFNNQMPDEEDELDNLVFDVKKRAKIEEYHKNFAIFIFPQIFIVPITSFCPMKYI